MPPPPAIDATAHGVTPSAVAASKDLSARGFAAVLRFAGPGALVAVGYMDPGNWATGLAAGSAYGYGLLFVIVASSMMAMVLQTLAAKLGIATGRDLAQACAERYPRPARISLWLLCEAAIVACDLAEVLGAAIALQLLFHLPLALGIVASGLQALLALALQARGVRRLEALVASLIVVVAGCFAVELAMARPDLPAVAAGVIPSPTLLRDPGALYLAIGILGATVMPHNLYLHSRLVLTRSFETSDHGRRRALKLGVIDVVFALSAALFVNAAILIMAGAVFHTRGLHNVAGLTEAHQLLSPLLGAGLAGVLFAVALLASGQNATVTGAMASQIVLEGFGIARLPRWALRLIARALAIIPALAAVLLLGEGSVTALLIGSQVVLSLQLPFAVGPLVQITSDRERMGALANGRLTRIVAWALFALIVAANGAMLIGLLRG
jgi:manganese transport protein